MITTIFSKKLNKSFIRRIFGLILVTIFLINGLAVPSVLAAERGNSSSSVYDYSAPGDNHSTITDSPTPPPNQNPTLTEKAESAVAKPFKWVGHKLAAPFRWVGNEFVDGIKGVIYLFTWGIFHLLGIFITFAFKVLQWSFLMQNFTQNNFVRVGWGIILNLTNIFFAFGLLIIAFSTVLNLDSYGMKQSLPRLIIIALLINVSLNICGMIIDVSEVLTMYFLDPVHITDQENFGAALANSLQIQKTMLPMQDNQPMTGGLTSSQEHVVQQSTWERIKKADGMNMIISMFGGIIVLAIAALTIFAAALFLIARMISLWILIILAPLAWFAWIFSKTQSYCSKWWDEFIKWVTFAPVYAFFFYLAVKFVDSGMLSQISSESGLNIIKMKTNDPAVNQALSSPELIIRYILTIGLLIGGLRYAEKSGVYGAKRFNSIVQGAGNKIKGFAKRRVYQAGRWAHRRTIAPAAGKLAEKASQIETEKFSFRHPFRTAQLRKRAAQRAYLWGAGALSPSQYKQAYEGWRAKEEKKIYPETEGSIYDAMNKIYSKEESHHRDLALQRELAERVDEEKTIPYNTDQRIADIQKATREKDWTGAAAKLIYLSSNNDLNAWFMDNWKNNPNLFKDLKIDKYNPETLAKYLNYILEKAGADEEKRAQILSKIADVSYGQGNMAPVSWSIYQNGRWQVLNSDDPTDQSKQIKNVNNMVGPMAGRKLITNIHPDGLVERDNEYNPTGLSDLGTSLIINNLSEEWLREFNHARTNTKEALASEEVIRDLQKIAEGDIPIKNLELKRELSKKAKAKSELIRNFIKQIQEATKGKGGKEKEEKKKEEKKSSLIDTDISDSHFDNLRRNNYRGK